jgi:hypothetical protein
MKPLLAVTMTLTSLLLAQRVASAQNVQVVVDRLTDYWARGDAASIAGLAAREGVSLDVDGRTVGPLSARQATALLRRLFDERQTINVRMMSAQIVGGRPSRASGEISWMMRPRGTTIPEKTSVFVALVLEDDRWRVTEIRFVRP